jgi:hypothetical protein
MRPYWKGYLKLALVSCPIALHAACSSTERIAFRQINKATGNRLRQAGFPCAFLKRGMSAGRVELLDDVRDRVAYARDFAEAALSDDLIERKAQREEIVCRACISFRPERIAAAERAPLPEFLEQGSNRGCIGRGHFGSMRAGSSETGAPCLLPCVLA